MPAYYSPGCLDKPNHKPSDHVYDMTAMEEASRPEDLSISYLHRTVRDYFKLPHVLESSVVQKKHKSFDTNVAMLMSYVIEVKINNLVFKKSTSYDEGIGLLCRAAQLECLTSKPHLDLVEELDRAINIRWGGEQPAFAKGHWFNSNPEWKQGKFELRRLWGTDLLCMANESKLNWYFNGKLAQLAPLIPY